MGVIKDTSVTVSSFVYSPVLKLRKGGHFLWFFLIIQSLSMSSVAESPSTTANVVREGNAAFSSSLYNALTNDYPSNFVSSPLSLSVVLAMLRLGTRGVSSREVDAVLRFPSENSELVEGLESLLESLNQAGEGGTILSANRIFVHQEFLLKKDFTSALTKHFKSSPLQLDFADSSSAAKIINAWVSEQTNAKITSLFSADSFDKYTRVVLANVLYFKGKWLVPFPAENTVKELFHLSESSTVQVDTMKQEGTFKYADFPELDSQALLLPFENKSLNLLVLLPNQIAGINSLGSKLQSTNILRVCQNKKFRPAKIELALPKFKLEVTLDIKRALQSLGLQTIFDAEKADLSGLLETEVSELEVSDVIQKVVIDINEQGAEAAAATGAQVRKTRSVDFPVEFNVNRPFLFAILHNSDTSVVNERDTSILFFGRILNPLLSHGEATPGRKDEL